MLLDDKKSTIQQLNKFCGGKSVFSYTCVTKRRVLVEVTLNTFAQAPEVVSEGIGMNRKSFMKSKILSHFNKGKISLSPTETIIMIPSELEHLESLVKLARRKRYSKFSDNQVTMVLTPTTWRICINKTH